LTLDHFIFWPKLPPNAGFGIKNLKKFPGGNTPGPAQLEGTSPSRTYPQHGDMPCAGHKLPRCWDLGPGNRSLKSKFTTTPLEIAKILRQSWCCSARLVVFHMSSGSASVHPCSACVDHLVVASLPPALRRRHAWGCVRRTFSCTYSQRDKQSENVMLPAPSSGWVEA